MPQQEQQNNATGTTLSQNRNQNQNQMNKANARPVVKWTIKLPCGNGSIIIVFIVNHIIIFIIITESAVLSKIIA